MFNSCECFVFFQSIFYRNPGTFYTELNEAIVLSAIKTPVQLSQASMMAVGQHANANDSRTIEWLLPTHILVYICNGEFGAFVIAWNLIMEYIVIVALISKALIIYIDAIFFDILDHIHLTQIVPMSWYLSEYFDVFALLVPIVIGGKLENNSEEDSMKICTPFFWRGNIQTSFLVMF